MASTKSPKYEDLRLVSFEALNTRISALHETTKHVSILIERLHNLDFRPGSIPLNIYIDDLDEEEPNVVTEMSHEIRDNLKEETENLELLEQEVRDFLGGEKGSHAQLLKDNLEQMISRANKDLNQSRRGFRNAIRTAKQNLLDSQIIEKELLIASLKKPEPTPTTPNISQFYQPKPLKTPKTPLTAEEKEVVASSDVTAALRRTHNLMLSELSRSQFANQTLSESTAALAELSEKYSTLDSLLAGSKNLLGTLVRSQKSDTWYLETAFKIMAFTVGWLIFRRWIYGPAWWLVWLPLKLLFKVSTTVLMALGVRRGQSVQIAPEVTSAVSSMHSERPSLAVHNQATRAPTVKGQQTSRGRAPIIVGGGGKGAPMKNNLPGQQVQESTSQQENTMVEEVGKIIDGENVESETDKPAKSEKQSGEQSGEQSEEQPASDHFNPNEEEIIPNPKKRMFDPHVEDKKWEAEQARKKDEL